MAYPKRLIEVDLPIRKISEYARNEKNMRSGHPWQLHIWWARRPWGACRAVAFSSLIPAPSDPNCPKDFIKKTVLLLSQFGFCRKEESDVKKIEEALLSLTSELARFEAGNENMWIDTAQELVNIANPETPVAIDPFAGYGAIPAEASRLGCQSIASDLNPVAVLCLKVMLEALPKHGEKMLELYEKGIVFIKKEAEKRLGQYYPKKSGKYPIAYLWARTVQCEGPNCGATIPLIGQEIPDRNYKSWIEIIGDKKNKEVIINLRQDKSIPKGLIRTAGGGHAFCPVCGVTTHKSSVKAQGKAGKMGHRLFGLALPLGERGGKKYINADLEDQIAYEKAVKKWETILKDNPSLEITEPLFLTYGLHVPPHYGIKTWGDLFSPRQKLSLYTLGVLVREYENHLQRAGIDKKLAKDVAAALALGVSNIVPLNNNLAWYSRGMNYCYKGMGISMKWDWGEANPLIDNYAGGIDFSYKTGTSALRSLLNNKIGKENSVFQLNATELNFPDDSADLFFTDPPYYDVVPYADLSDLCFVWLKRILYHDFNDLLKGNLTPKAEQIVVNPYSVDDGRGEQTPEKYRLRMTKSFVEARRILKHNGIGCVVFAHKGTKAWEALLASIIDAGFIVTASWPIDTERANRMRANNSAALQTSIHLVIRPRENSYGSQRTDAIGDWREVQVELPQRIHEWMPRLALEGVVGADAIFSCLGPALGIFSRYSRVEKPNGNIVTLREYLEKIWTAVSQEALNMVFIGGEASSFENDARLTAMWLWTLTTAVKESHIDNNDTENDDEEDQVSGRQLGGFTLEYDTARKIAQGLGATLEDLKTLVEIKGETARLISIIERTEKLFGTPDIKQQRLRKKNKSIQLAISFHDREEEEKYELTELSIEQTGKTVLDRLHQAMLLFGRGRMAALKKFLVEDGAGKDDRFWKLAQALTSLYPKDTNERRWVEAVQTYKKNLGF